MDVCNAHGIVGCPACRLGHAVVPLLGQPAQQPQQAVAAPPSNQTLLAGGIILNAGKPIDLPDGRGQLPTLLFTFMHPDGSGLPIGSFLLAFDPANEAKLVSMFDQALAASLDIARPAPPANNPEGTPPV